MIGIFMFLIMVTVEIGLGIFSIITKYNQSRIRSITRISEGIAFLFLIILSIIHWKNIYYALAAFLFILSVVGGVGLVRKKEEKLPYKVKSTVFKFIGMTLLIFIVTLPSILFPEYKELVPTGNNKVATVTYAYIDKNRVETYTNTSENRKLNVEFWYPKNGQGTYPLVVFSHGSFGIKESNETLFNELASYGYVVCSIDHTYQCLSTTDDKGNTIKMDKGYSKEILIEDAKKNKEQSYEFYQKWMKVRTGDINYVIDNIIAEVKNNTSDNVYKLIDTTKIGVMGHSLGGSAALGIGRIRNDINSVISLEAPFMCDIKGVKDNEFVFLDEKYPVPLLNVYSDSSYRHLGQWPQYAENYALLSSAKAFNVYISGVGHFSLTDMALAYPILTQILNGEKSKKSTEECLKLINKLTLEFFDCYLKGKGKFKANGTY